MTRIGTKMHPRGGARLAALGCLAAIAMLGLSCGGKTAEGGAQRVIVLGMDGLDYDLTSRLMSEGRMPNFSRLQEMGGFQPLATSIPPQSPVAWSNFVTGTDSGGHGIFDFVHRDPETIMPYLSTSRTKGSEKTLTLGKWQIPLEGGTVELLRRGQPFWEVLENHGIETMMVRMPANFPPSGTATHELSGMGTPDLLGTPGMFSFYTSELFAYQGEDISGGHVYEVYPYNNMVEATLYGPDNPFLVEREKAQAPFKVYIDPEADLVKLELGEQERILKVGEWSDWLKVEFELAPLQTLSGIVRFYLKQAHPELELYASPLNIDPEEPAMPISTPESWSADLAEATGLYFTQEMPEDVKIISADIFDIGEFLSQTRLTANEFKKQYEYLLDQFEDGLFFYYFGDVDQVCHVLFHTMDPEHPVYVEERDAPYAHVIEDLYVEMDGIVGYTLERMPEDTLLVVMSDHGFTSWRRAFNLNTWLLENGYVVLEDPDRKDPGLYLNVDWSRTRAYGLGLNGLYVNLQGREAQGIVRPEDREALMAEIAGKLLAIIDPKTETPAVTKVYPREETYDDLGELELGPDLQIGYAKGTRCSSGSAIGEFPPGIIVDNVDEWSGDHLMDHEAVPGILLTTRAFKKPATSLKNLASSILVEFGIEGFPFVGNEATKSEG